MARCLLRQGRHRAAFHHDLAANVRAGMEIPELHQNAGIRRRSLGPGSSAWHQAAEASLLDHISTVEISQTWYGDDCHGAAHSPLAEMGVSWSCSRNRRNSSALFCSRLPVRNLEIAQVERKPPYTFQPRNGWTIYWWSQSESNRRPLECHSSALPTELWPHLARLWEPRAFQWPVDAGTPPSSGATAVARQPQVVKSHIEGDLKSLPRSRCHCR
jgi:hypothetical protein